MPDEPRPSELLELAARYLAAAELVTNKRLARRYRETARLLSMVATSDIPAPRVLAAARSALASDPELGTIGDVEASLSRGAAISAGRTKAPTRLQQLMQERGLSLPELWEALPAPRPALETLKAWVKPGAGGRKVPRKWAQKLAKYFGDASLLDDDSWPRGIR